MILCLDGGTTNTRIRLMDGTRTVDAEAVKIGSSERDNRALRDAVAQMIRTLLTRNGLRQADIPAILAAGMVTSEFGLYELPHLLLPAGIDELARGAKRVEIPEITSIPFWFVPGVKGTDAEPDMMRGEETECVGLCAAMGVREPAAVILPGTHNKVILFDGERMTAIASMMSGEMIAALSGHTLLRHSLPDPLPKAYDETALFAGADYCRQYGLTDAALRVRSIAKAGTRTPEWLSSYLVGAVLYCDIISIREKSHGYPLLIGGSDPLRSEVTLLAARYLDNRLLPVDPDLSAAATAVGQDRIYSAICR